MLATNPIHGRSEIAGSAPRNSDEVTIPVVASNTPAVSAPSSLAPARRDHSATPSASHTACNTRTKSNQNGVVAIHISGDATP